MATSERPTGQGEDVLCRFCGKAIRERTNRQGETVWTRTGPTGPMVICEGSPNDYWHSPYRPDDPEQGHTFRIEVTSRGSYGVVGEEGHTDAEEFMGGPMTIDIRAWNLPDALRQAAAVFPAIWHLDAEPATEQSAPSGGAS